MNVQKMRRQVERTRPCGARYLHGPGLPVEVCRLVGEHDRHDWPSLPLDPVHASVAAAASAFAMFGHSLKDFTLR
jgi:hypothetical protein